MQFKPLVIFGCVHIGHEDADLKLAKKYVEWVKEHNAYALLLADNHECALPHKGHMMFTQNMKPQEQYEYGIELFSPIAKNIVGACTGNHALRAKKVAGIDLDKCMSDKLGYSNRYYPHQGFITLKVGSQRYNIAFKHGTGVGSNIFGNTVALLRSYPSADIVCASHSHQLSHTITGYWDVINSSRVIHTVHHIVTGSMLNYPDYADEAGYTPQPKGFAILWLHSYNKKDTYVDISGL